MSLFKQIKAAAPEKKKIPGVVASSELKRIERLPRRVLKPDPKLVWAVTEYFKRPEGELTLRWIQAAMLYEAARCNGALGKIGVGEGKSLICQLLPGAMDSKKSVLLVPSQLYDKTMREIEQLWSKHFKLPSGLEIHTYEELSQAKNATLLEDKTGLDLIILDEAHRLKRPKSARTKRWRRFMRENPSCRLVAMSGTMGNRSVSEYAHFSELALGKGSPLPSGHHELIDWCGALDVDPLEPRAPGALMRFCEEGESVRDGFRRRFAETPGVIVTHKPGFQGSILVKQSSLKKMPGVIEAARNEVKKTWEIGDEVITEATHLARVMKQLACGFYYKWEWPNGRDQVWLERRREWDRQVRHFLRYRSRAGLDSKKLVTEAVKSGRITDSEIRKAWLEWSEVADRPGPETVPVWLSDFALKHAVKWAEQQKERAIVWYQHRAVGAKLVEMGLPVYRAGDDSELAREPVIYCSVKAQSEGKNLQYRFHKNLLISMVSNGGVLEQLLGRTHRPGQEEDEILLEWNAHSPEMLAAYEQVLKDAEFARDNEGTPQKILLAQRL